MGAYDPPFSTQPPTYLLDPARARTVIRELDALPTRLPPASVAFGDIKGFNSLEKKPTKITVPPGNDIAFMNMLTPR